MQISPNSSGRGDARLDAEELADAQGRREHKKDAVRRALRSAALRLVEERGLHEATVEDITEAAGVSKRTFFNYFSCKEDALVGPGRELGEHIADELARRPAEESTLQALHAVLRGVVAAAERSPGRLADWATRIQLVQTYPDVLVPRQLAAFADLERSIIAGVVRRTGAEDVVDAPQVDGATRLFPAVAAAAAVAMLRVAFNRWRQQGNRTPLPALVDRAFDELAGLIADPAPRPRPRRPPSGVSRSGTPPSGTPRSGTPRSGSSSSVGRG